MKKSQEGLSCQVLTYSLEHEADYTATDITYDEFGHASFTVCHRGQALGVCSLSVPGVHNVSNALSAVAAARLLNLSWEVISEDCTAYRHRPAFPVQGADRRSDHH